MISQFGYKLETGRLQGESFNQLHLLDSTLLKRQLDNSATKFKDWENLRSTCFSDLYDTSKSDSSTTWRIVTQPSTALTLDYLPDSRTGGMEIWHKLMNPCMSVML